jgi:methylmalonyl-CoA mutase cobalamin-binding domain/chain
MSLIGGVVNLDLLQRLRNCVTQLRLEDTLKLIGAAKSSIQVEIILKALSEGMNEVGKKYETGEYFLSELIFAGEIMKRAIEELKPYLKTASTQKIGRIVVGTVKGDIHDIGKNIFIMFATSAGFDVIDLGVDVPVELFVAKVKEVKPDILGMSALMSTTQEYMAMVIEALRKEGLRDGVKIILGGAAVNERFAQQVGADAAANDAILGVEICKRWALSK